MKKIISLILILNFIHTISHAQTGSTCALANEITSLPFTQSGLTISANNYSFPGDPGYLYMSGNDYVFKYTPAILQKVNIKLSNTTGHVVSILVFNNCPDVPGTICINKAEGAYSGNASLICDSLYANSTYFIVVSTSSYFSVSNFDINIQELFPIDCGVAYLNRPKTHCGLGTQEKINLVIENFGETAVDSFPVAMRINNGSEIVEMCPFNMGPANSASYSTYFEFATPVDMSTIGATYNIKCYTKIIGDNHHINDTNITNITNSIQISSFPYFENFESGPGGWVTEWDDSKYPFTTWQYGYPNSPGLNTTASGTNIWKTNLTGQYSQNEDSYLIGPCFDFTNISHPWIDMKIWYKLKTADFVTLEYCTNPAAGIQTWNRMGNANEGTNWYNVPLGLPSSKIGWIDSSLTWKNAIHELTGLGGLPQVMFRIRFRNTSNQTNEGFAIDDIKIFQALDNNLTVSNIITPFNGCGHSSTENVTITLKNPGTAPQSGFNIAYKLNNNSYITELFTDTIHPGDSAQFTFSQPIDLSLPGSYTLIAKSMLIADSDTTNDIKYVTIINYPTVTNFPYNQNFESDNGGWFADGLNSTWAWGIVTDTVITHAASASKCWKTNLSGSCGSPEQSYLTGPCFDFSGLKNPYVKMNIWYETVGVFNSPGAMLETSTDGGITWVNTGSHTDPDWYNQGFNWLGHSHNWVAVVHNLLKDTGMVSVQFRLAFTGINLPGLAFDDFQICDAPVAKYYYTISGPQVTFNSSSTSNAISYNWNFGDGSVSNLQNPVHTFLNDTNYVTLIASNNCNTDTIQKMIVVCQSPHADFTVNINGHDANFSSANSSYTTSYQWDFGDGTLSSLPDPNHTFAAESSIVTLIVTNSCNSDTITSVVYLCDLPVSDFAFTYSGSTASFTNNSINATTYLWDFGDGTTSNLQNPTHVFAGLNSPVTLITTNSCSSDTLLLTVYLCELSIADFTYSVTGNQVDFVCTTPNIINCHWNFGDGDTSSNINPSHVFTGVSSIVSLIVNNGCSIDTIIKPISICNSPLASFTYNVSGYQVDFTSTSTYATNYTWYFGDGGISHLQNPSHLFSGNNSNIRLIVTNLCSSDTIDMTIQTCESPVAEFNYTHNGSIATFTCTTNGATSYKWNFGDGTGSTVQNPSHSFAKDTNIVTLIVFNYCSSDTVKDTIFTCKLAIADFDYSTFNTWPAVTFINSSVNATSYFWDFKDGTTSTFENPNHTFIKDTNLVILISTNHCSTDTLEQSIVKSGIEETYLHTIRIFPNPAHTELYLELKKSNEDINLSIINTEGKTVFTDQFRDNSLMKKIDVRNFHKGIYCLKIQTKQTAIIRKFIIE